MGRALACILHTSGKEQLRIQETLSPLFSAWSNLLPSWNKMKGREASTEEGFVEGGLFMKCYSKHLIFQLCEESISWQTSSQNVYSEWPGHPEPAYSSIRVLRFLGHKNVLLTDG